jgi:CHC2 zinc finger
MSKAARQRPDFALIQQQTLENVESIAQEHGVHLRRGRGACPIHGGTGPNFAVTDGRGFYCFVCHAKGDAIDLLRLFHCPHLSRRAGRVAILTALAHDGCARGWSTPRTPKHVLPAHTKNATTTGPSLAHLPFLGVLYSELSLCETGRRYLLNRRLDGNIAYDRGVRSIVDWTSMELLIRSRSLEQEAGDAGFELGPSGFTTPYYARRNAPSLLFFYLTPEGPVGVTLRTLIGLQPKTLAMKGCPVVTPWGLESVVGDPEVVHVTEGEIDGLTLSHFGGPVIAVPGGNAVPGGVAAEWLKTVGTAGTIVLWMDQDEGGKRAGDAFAQAVLANSSTAPRIRVVTHDLGPLDVNDLVRAGFARIVVEGMGESHD